MDALIAFFTRVLADAGIEWVAILLLGFACLWLMRTYVTMTGGIIRRAALFREKMTGAFKQLYELVKVMPDAIIKEVRHVGRAVRSDIKELRQDIRDFRDELRKRGGDR